MLAEHIEAGYCVVYCNDIAIFSQIDDLLIHLQHLEAVLTSLREHQLLAKCSKCEFMQRKSEFLGFMVIGDGVRQLPSKIEAYIQRGLVRFGHQLPVMPDAVQVSLLVAV